MPLLGKAILINWSNVAEESRDQYYEWHDREHMVGRVRLPGFRRGRRLWSQGADRDVLNIYEVDDLEVLTGEAYSKKASSPSPNYKLAGKIITDAIRALAHVRYTSGSAMGGNMLTLRFGLDSGDHVERRLVQDLLQPLSDIRGVVGVHLCVADGPASSLVTADREGRPTAVPSWSLLIEATSGETLRLAEQLHLTESQLMAHGCTGPFSVGHYALQMMISKADIAVP